jgi:ferredoxin-type protein NapH
MKNKISRMHVQFLATIAQNAYFKGFVEGNIYRGSIKKLCVPGLNCYSCPGALGSCPIGSLQAIASDIKFNLSFYVTGFLLIVGTFAGRFICGWVCPFGLIQELLYKVPVLKLKETRYFRILIYIKYIFLPVFVLILPALLVNIVGIGRPTFCKYICPAGTLEAGVPLVILNKPLQSTIGALFYWKVLLLITTIFLSILIFRPFCKYVCPLGAIYSLFNPISLLGLQVAKEKCTSCGLCEKACKMNVATYKKPNSQECIRCAHCIDLCPNKAISIKSFNKHQYEIFSVVFRNKSFW